MRKFARKFTAKFGVARFGYVPVSLVWVMASGGSVLAQTQAAPLAVEAAPLAAADTPVAEAPAEGASDDATTTSTKTPVTRGREIVVVADRIKGQVEAPQPPVAVFDEEDIAAYGATTVDDLITAISPQTGSGRGRGASGPVILVNGQRITNFREMMNYPPESIRRVEVLPEEVALRFGYSADQRVVNIILKDHYQARTVEAELALSDSIGANTLKGMASVLKIDKGKRMNLTVKADRTNPVTEAQAKILQASGTTPTVASDPSPAANRTVVSNTKDYSLNGTYTAPIGKDGIGGNMTFNALASRADVTGLAGLNTYSPATDVLRTFDGALTRRTLTDTYSAGAGLNKRLLDWNLSATADISHVDATTTTANRVSDNAVLAAALASGIAPSGGFTTAKSKTDTVTTLVTLSGRPVALPAGKMAVTVKGGFNYTALNASSTSTLSPTSNLKRGDASLGVNLGIPLTSRREHVGEALGDITLNLAASADHLSDFGELVDWSAGLTWNVTDKLGFQASYMYDEAAPSLSNLGSPLVATYNVSVYDFVKSQTVLATVITGGNSALVKEHRNDIKLGMNWTPPILKGASNLVVEYFNNRSSNVTSAFPTTLTTAIEAAYPGRVTRDATTGLITSIDRRAITLAETRDEHVRWGFNIGGNMGKEIKAQGRGPMGMFGGGPPPGGGRPGGPGGAGGPPPGGGMGGPPPGGGGPGGPGGGRGGRYEGRWNLSLYHTVYFVNRVQVAASGPSLDLLGGDALSGGGTARHSLEGEGGFFFKGIGLRMNGTWSAPTHVNGSGVPGSTDLRFGSLFKLNTRLFFDLGQQKRLVKETPFFKDARFSIGAKNIFNQRQRVTDSNGNTPLSYQPLYMDAQGRTIEVEFRKMF
ncbi:outer membrane receptor protein involved in Fe transport [Novosphingobium sp. SG751A]|uniref:TonB-dependent receptor n=1 Tax=Novosphingobium sp. SG751A TaxID=2587000 RepID=UPI0015524D35|nr:TonB-dependent receptor [Novosphingobium sp. SG751A]NOW44008.1 outer membrane receptor protein involved in Fe transport [Novosphingobium sp. SG751A]